MSDNLLIKRECESLLGGGGTYHADLIEAKKSARVSCDGIIREEGFVLVFGCNTCTSKNVQDRLKQDTIACTEQCRKTMNNCVYDGMSNEWGGYYNTDQHPSCSPLKSTSLPGCAESSSSETVESSSSEVVESSSSEEIDSSSSDGDESSSSSGDEECGTGTGHCPYSSSSSKIGPHGYVEDIDPCPNDDYMRLEGFGSALGVFQNYVYACIESRKLKLPRFTQKPGFFGDLKIDGGCSTYSEKYGGNLFWIETNLPYVYLVSSNRVSCTDWWHCGSMQEPVINIQDFYICQNSNRNYTEEYVTHDPKQGCRLIRNYYGIHFEMRITESMLKTDAPLQKADTGLDEYEELFPSNYSLEQLINNPTVISKFEQCKETLRQYYGYNLTSSSLTQSSNSSETSSSSQQESSSSSDETESSSSNENESSSSLGDEASSSSLQIESSSSEFVYSSSDDGVFVAGGDQVHSPDQIIRDGLDNMEPGSCYSLNPARGTQYGWMNTDAKDSWWWREVDCETGEKVDKNRVGVCPGFPLDNVPGNPKNACFAYNGTCYKCNPDRGSECSNSWLWQGTFTSANVGWWYEKVDCDNPFEEDFDGQCPDRFYLEKSVADNHDYFEIKNYTVEYSVSQKDYDALGRRLNGTRSKFLRTFKKRENKIAPISNNTFDVGSVIYIPIEKMGLSQKFLAKQDDQCTDYSCGNLGIDYGIGNDIGVYCGYLCTKLNMENGFLRVEVKEKVQTGSCGENNPKYTITFKLPATATIKRKNIYYVAPIGYKMGDRVVTKDDYEAVERHEKGHMKSYSCLEDKKMFKSEYEFELEGVCEKEFTCNKNGVIKGLAQKIKDSVTVQKGTGIDALIKYNKNLWQKMCGWYHKNFSRYDGPGGPKNPKDIDCPTTETLLKGKYDLTGCEVLE